MSSSSSSSSSKIFKAPAGSRAQAANNAATQLLRDDKPGEALAILERALKASPSARASSTLLANKGLCLEQLGRNDEAVLALEASVAARPSNEEAKHILNSLKATQLLGQALKKVEGNEFSNALALFEQAGALDPDGDGTWLYNKARMLTKLGRYDEALEALLKFKEGLDPNDAEEQTIMLPLLGELLCKRERWSEAIAAIDGAIVANLELPASLLFNYGVALLKTQNLTKARHAFDDVIAYFPNYGLAYDALASIDAQEGAAHCKKGEFGEAIPKLYAAVRRTPKATTLYNLALALLKERRAPEAKEQFDALLKLDPNHSYAKDGAEAARLMIEGGDYRDAPPPTTTEDADEYYESYPSAAVAPQKRIYQIANEKGVGSLASQDDMVMLLSGIEEWVAGALGPLEQRVVALEQAAEAAGGIVGSASEDRAVLQLLFDRVALLEDTQQQTTSGGYYDQDDQGSAEYGARDASSEVRQHAESLEKRIRSLEKLVFGTTTTSNQAITGSGLLGDDDAEEDETAAQVPAPTTSMSMTAKLAVQEQRFTKMASELETQAKEIEKLKEMQEKLLARLDGGAVPRRPSLGGNTITIEKKFRKPETGANVGAMEGPNMLDELKAATKRRAAKRREMGLTLRD
ncbi:hypothetical protein CTAYLR_008659 [Chrysophaeum taylorii]|uniref:Uncharacterized protein n=1 Tax=Chrysophaeum taylorii TaxID=2483200 RepID=A0AAD7XHP7_9STRA|nr:hypothetical protein CTAYLR_008659 [Chrysophaeum taylorii]